MSQQGGARIRWTGIVWRTRAGLLVFLLAAVAVVVPPQMSDMLADLADLGGGSWRAAAAFHLAMILMGLSLWYWARTVVLAYLQRPDGRETRLQIAALSGGDNLTRIAFEQVPRLLFAGTALIAAYAAYDSRKWLQLGIVLLWAVFLYRALVRRVAWQEQLGFTTQARIIPARDQATSWPGRLWQRLLELLDYGPFGAIVARTLLAVTTGVFAFCAVLGFVPNSVGYTSLVAGWLPGPSMALFLFGLGVAPLTAITYTVDRSTRTITLFGFVLHVRRVPAILILLVLMGASAQIFNLHAVRIAEGQDGIDPHTRVSLAQYFQQWAAQCAPGNGPVRPIIVAVSGGASRAGLWGARVLAQIDESVQRTKSQGASIFAVSSVSGGSLGVAAYLSMRAGQAGDARADGPQNCTLAALGTDSKGPDAQTRDLDAMRWDAVASALRADALAPALAGMLLNDAPRDLAAFVAIPVAKIYDLIRNNPHKKTIFRGNDRAAALELAFEHNWQTEGVDQIAKLPGPTPFGLDRSYLSLFYEAPGRLRRYVPAWIANGTDAQLGDRLITAPFKVDNEEFCSGDGRWYAPKPHACNKHHISFAWNVLGPFMSSRDVLALLKADVPISTAIDNTSRFPFLSPAGELTPVPDPDADNPSGGQNGGKKLRDAQIVDGGYFENEGLMSALEIARWLRDYGPALLAAPNAPDARRPVYPIVVVATADADTGITDREIARCGNRLPVNPATPNGQARQAQLLVPVLGLNAVRGGHSRAILKEAQQAFCNEAGHQAFFHFYLYNSERADVPLNWTLSDQVARYIWDDAINVCGNLADRMNMDAALHSPPQGWTPDAHRTDIFVCTSAPVRQPLQRLPALMTGAGNSPAPAPSATE